MYNAFVLIAIASISFCALQNNSCKNKTANSNSAVPNSTATPANANAMTTDSNAPRPSATPRAANQRQLAGLWGGLHVTLEISEQGATLEFDCATGSINEPILLDSAGRFDVTGSYTREGPGPIRQGVNREARAHYSGSVTDEKMTLTVQLEGSSEPLFNLSLVRGNPGKIRRCY